MDVFPLLQFQEVLFSLSTFQYYLMKFYNLSGTNDSLHVYELMLRQFSFTFR